MREGKVLGKGGKKEKEPKKETKPPIPTENKQKGESSQIQYENIIQALQQKRKKAKSKKKGGGRKGGKRRGKGLLRFAELSDMSDPTD